MNEIFVAVLIIGGVGLLGGILLSVVSSLCDKGDGDEQLARIRDALPGANCGACGFAGCDAYAEAVNSGQAAPNLCAPGGKATAQALSEILGVEVNAQEYRALVSCQGSVDATETKHNYMGLSSCAAAAALCGGPQACPTGCIGLGDCVAVCNFGAISVENGLAAVNSAVCNGCSSCVKTCPKGIIQLVPRKKTAHVLCSNHQKGGVVRKLCTKACTGCTACMRKCSYGAIKMQDNLAVIDPDLCTACGACVEICPQGVIVL